MHFAAGIVFLSLITFQGLVAQSPRVLSSREISKLIPLKIKGYHLKGESKSTQVKVGTLTYALCERSFAHGDKTVKILLFDYADAAIMYDQAIRKWHQMQQIETDTSVFRPFARPGVSGWESYTDSGNQAQLVLGVNNRFFLTLTGENIAPDELRRIFRDFNIDSYPK
jgi:hypothetical protein